MPAEEQQRIIQAYATTTTAMRTSVLAAVLALFRSLGSWRERDVPRFLATAVPLVAGGQQQIWALTQAYLAQLLTDMDGRPPIAGTPPRTGAQLRAVDPAEEYTRPFRTIWAALAEPEDPTPAPAPADRPRPPEDALARAHRAAMQRAQDLVVTDLQLAKTHAAQEVLGDDESFTGFRRVLTGSTSCGLCVVASTQRYRRQELLPIHPGCDCAVAPILGDQDPGQVIDSDLLEDVHDAIQQRFGVSDRGGRDPIDYRHVLVTHEHGEIGPILARAGHKFTGPDDI